MARNKQASYAKRKREQARQAKAAEKRARRRERAANKGPGGFEYAESTSSPQNSKPSDAEVMRAIERAMNPGKARSRSRTSTPGSAKLFVGNVDYDIEENELKELFVQNGFDVITANVARDRASGQSRGFAFVELGSPLQAGDALQKMEGVEIRGRELRLRPADR